MSKKQLVVTLFLSIVIMALAVCLALATPVTGGAGTAADPYKVSTLTHLKKALAYAVSIGSSESNPYYIQITVTEELKIESNRHIHLSAPTLGNKAAFQLGDTYKGAILLAIGNTSLTLENIIVDGRNVAALAPLVNVGESAQLNVLKSTVFKNNNNTSVPEGI